MALDTQYIQLDISKQPTPQQVRLGQGDANATQLVVSVFDDGEAYDLTGYSVRLCMRLPKNGGYYDVDGTKSGNVATFDIDESYAASVSGFDGFGYVDILDGDEVICSTSRFQLVVLQCASEGVDVSEQYIDSVNDAIDRAIAAAEAAEGIVLQDVPTMSTTVKGGAMVGDGLAIDDGVLSVDASTVSDGTLPVAHGGTGATTAADARTSLSVYSKSEVYSTSEAYSKNEMDTALAGKAASSHTHTKSDITDFGSYLPTAGGTMTGQLQFSGLDALPQDNTTTADGFFPLGINTFASGGRVAYKTLAYFKQWAGIDSETVTSGILTAASGITIVSQSLVRFGKTAMLELNLKHSSAWTAGTQYGVGTIASSYLPALNTGGTFHNSGTAVLLSAGGVYVRPAVSGMSELAANAEFSVRITYILA